jgi:titin
MRRTRWLLVALLAALCAIPAGDAGAAITGVVYNPANQHYYKLYTTLQTWAQSNAAAQSVGGYLCSVTDSTEKSWLVSNSFCGNTPWIGLTDEAVENTWVWSSGEAYSYTNWNSGEPNNSGNEDYVTIRTDGTWNDWTATGTAYYIVEWNNDPNLPTDPANLRATNVTNNRVDLAWDDTSTGESNFELERALGSAAFAQIALPVADSTTYSDQGLSAETAYRYRIRAANANGYSLYSNTLSVTTGPPAPTNLLATAQSARQVVLSWVDTASAESGFEVERGNGSPGSGFTLVATQPPNATGYTDNAVLPEKTYSYRVRAAGAGGKSTYTSEASVTTPLAAPTGVTAEGTTDELVTLSWEDDSLGETGFEVVRGSGCPAQTFAPLTITAPDVTTIYDDTVQPERSYTYRVRALKPNGQSAWTADRCITTPPYAPTNAVATSESAGRVRVTWTDVSHIETSYEVMRAKASDLLFERVTIVGANVTEYLDTTAGQETSYVYRVATIGNNGRSGWSVAEQVDTAAMLVIRKASIVRPKKSGSPSKLTVSGEFDVGGRNVDVGTAATFGVGTGLLGVAAPVKKGSSYTFSAAGVKVTLKPSSGSSRVGFTLQTDDAHVALPGPDDTLTIAYENGSFRAVGTVRLAGGVFLPPKKGSYVDPPFNVVTVVASLKSGAKDTLSVKGGFYPTDGVPAAAPEVHVSFGPYDLVAASLDFKRVGNSWVFKESGLGSTTVTLDYAKGTLSVVVKGVELGSYGAGSEPVHVLVEFAGVHFEDTPSLASNGKSLKY